MGDSSLAHGDDRCSCKPVSSWISLLNFHAICPVWGQMIHFCGGCSSKDPGIVADSIMIQLPFGVQRNSVKKQPFWGPVCPQT